MNRVAIFLSYIGGKTYDLLRNLLAPHLPIDTELDELIATLETLGRFRVHAQNVRMICDS